MIQEDSWRSIECQYVTFDWIVQQLFAEGGVILVSNPRDEVEEFWTIFTEAINFFVIIAEVPSNYVVNIHFDVDTILF